MYKTLREGGGEEGGEESRVAAMPVPMLPRAGQSAAICIDKVHICKPRFVMGAFTASVFFQEQSRRVQLEAMVTRGHFLGHVTHEPHTLAVVGVR